MSRAWWLAVGLVAFGCSGGPDPENDVLPPGLTVAVIGDGARLDESDDPDQATPTISSGASLTVRDDPGVLRETPADVERRARSHPAQADAIRAAGPRRFEAGTARSRPVRVTVESGRFQGLSGSVPRMSLRLVP